MTNVTSRTLRRELEKINSWLDEAGADFRLLSPCTRPAKGGLAVNEYPIRDDGKVQGTGYTRPAGRGTARECIASAYKHYAYFAAANIRKRLNDT